MLPSTVHRRGIFHRGFRCPLNNFENICSQRDASDGHIRQQESHQPDTRERAQMTFPESKHRETALRLQIGNQTSTTASDHTRFLLHSAGRYCCSQATHIRALAYQPFFYEGETGPARCLNPGSGPTTCTLAQMKKMQ